MNKLNIHLNVLIVTIKKIETFIQHFYAEALT